nr:hypothetical protein OH820_19055 [Streptomyces sp. NBC_00857]
MPVKATHTTLLAGRDAVYDPRARQGSVPVEFHFDDGSTLDGALILTSTELERLYAQTSRLLDAHERALGGQQRSGTDPRDPVLITRVLVCTVGAGPASGPMREELSA